MTLAFAKHRSSQSFEFRLLHLITSLDILPLREALDHAFGSRLILLQHNLVSLKHRVSLHENLPRLRLANHFRPQLGSVPFVDARDVFVQRLAALQIGRGLENVQLL